LNPGSAPQVLAIQSSSCIGWKMAGRPSGMKQGQLQYTHVCTDYIRWNGRGSSGSFVEYVYQRPRKIHPGCIIQYNTASSIILLNNPNVPQLPRLGLGKEC
jgi:hypothetical protein